MRNKSMERVREIMQPEYKTFPMHHKGIAGRQVTTLFSVFGNIDAYNDRIMPGAFNSTFAQRGTKILHLWQHDMMSPPIAVVKSLSEIPRDQLPSEVLQQYPDAMGGAEAVSEFLSDERSDAIFQALKAGSPLQASFAYDALSFDFQTQDDTQIRNLRELRLWEVSTVLWGANDATLGSKALLLPLETLLDQFEMRLKGGARHNASDQEMLNAIHQMVVDLGCTNCEGSKSMGDAEDDKKDRADEMSLILRKAEAFLLDERVEEFLSSAK